MGVEEEAMARGVVVMGMIRLVRQGWGVLCRVL